MGLAAEVAAERTCELRERSFLTFCSAHYDADATVKQNMTLGHTARWPELDKLSSGDHEDVGCRVTQDPIQRLPGEQRYGCPAAQKAVVAGTVHGKRPESQV